MPGGQSQPLLNPNIYNLPKREIWARVACDKFSIMACWRWFLCSNPSNWSASDLQRQDYYAETWCVPNEYGAEGEVISSGKEYIGACTKGIDCTWCCCFPIVDTIVIRPIGGAAAFLCGSIADAVSSCCSEKTPKPIQPNAERGATPPAVVTTSARPSAQVTVVDGAPALAITAGVQPAPVSSAPTAQP